MHVTGSQNTIMKLGTYITTHAAFKENNCYIVEGYTPIMPSYAPILKGNDIENIIAYIKTLK